MVFLCIKGPLFIRNNLFKAQNILFYSKKKYFLAFLCINLLTSSFKIDILVFGATNQLNFEINAIKLIQIFVDRQAFR